MSRTIGKIVLRASRTGDVTEPFDREYLMPLCKSTIKMSSRSRSNFKISSETCSNLDPKGEKRPPALIKRFAGPRNRLNLSGIVARVKADHDRRVGDERQFVCNHGLDQSSQERRRQFCPACVPRRIQGRTACNRHERQITDEPQNITTG